MSQALAFLAAALAAAAVGELIAAAPRPRRRSRLLRIAPRLRVPGGLEQRIAAAGRPAGLGPREVMALKALCAAAAVALGLMLGTVAPGRLGVLLAAGAPAAGFLAPDLWLRRRARARLAAARRALPALLDLMRVTVDAGFGPADAMAAVAGRASGPLAEEWRAVGREVELGVPLADALRGLEQRLPMPETRAFVAALGRALRHGAPLGHALSSQARDARLGRRRRIQEEAARAAPKIQLVVALLLVPSVMLLVAAALAAALLDGGGLSPGGR